LSKEFVKVPVAATLNGVGYDPSGDVVSLAFVVRGGPDPAGGDWVSGSWEPDGSGGWLARTLVGPGAKVLPVGTYEVWVKVADNPEVPVRSVGVLQVT
jgi:hypothetical protein